MGAGRPRAPLPLLQPSRGRHGRGSPFPRCSAPGPSAWVSDCESQRSRRARRPPLPLGLPHSGCEGAGARRSIETGVELGGLERRRIGAGARVARRVSAASAEARLRVSGTKAAAAPSAPAVGAHPPPPPSRRGVRRRRRPRGSESHVGQQPLGAGTGPARMSRPLCEARRGPTRPGPAAPGRAAAGASRGSGFGPQAGRALSLPARPALPAPPRAGPNAPRSLPVAARLPFLVSFFFPRVAAGWPGCPAGLALFPASPSPCVPPPQAGSFLPCSGPAFICLSFSVFFPDDLLLGHVPSSRRDQKVKGTKVRPRFAGGRRPGWGRVRRAVGAVARGRARGKDLSEAARVAGAVRGAIAPFGVALQLAGSFFR